MGVKISSSSFTRYIISVSAGMLSLVTKYTLKAVCGGCILNRKMDMDALRSCNSGFNSEARSLVCALKTPQPLSPAIQATPRQKAELISYTKHSISQAASQPAKQSEQLSPSQSWPLSVLDSLSTKERQV